MERKILFIGIRKLHSSKKEKDFYMVDYVDIEDNTPNTDYITLEEYNRIGHKMKEKKRVEATGIFALNQFKKGYLADIKA